MNDDLPDGWDTDPGSQPPQAGSSPLQWGVFLRRWIDESGEAEPSPADVLGLARRVGFGLAEGVRMLGAFEARAKAPLHVPEVTATDCPTPKPLWFLSRTTLTLLVIPTPCGAWLCPVCGTQRAAEAGGLMERVLDPFYGGWVGRLDKGNRVGDRVRQRRSAARRGGADVVGVRVLTTDGGYEVSSVDLSGRTPPTDGRWMAPRDLNHLVMNVLQDGQIVRRVQPYPARETAAAPEQAHGTSDLLFIGVFNSATRQQILDRVRDEAERSFDVKPGEDMARHENVPLGWFEDAMRRHAGDVMRERSEEAGWE